MRILIAPDKFKASLTAGEAAAAISRGILRVFPDAVIGRVPAADGGEGTASALASAMDGEMVVCDTCDALGRKLRAEYGWIPHAKTAVLEMSQAAGLWRLAEGERDPLETSTLGVGRMLRDAVRRGAEKILLGLGGSATNDAGCGMGAALGWRFLDAEGGELFPSPSALRKLAEVEPPDPFPARGFRVTGLCDVRNPLLGDRGASAVFGPQKGASEQTIAELEDILGRVADIVERALGKTFRETPGAGAAGGLGFGILAFAAGRLEPGFKTIAAMLDLPEKIRAADLVVTAEGKLDRQTGEGKVPDGVAALARGAGKPVIAFGGALEHEDHLHQHFDALIPLANRPMGLDESRDRAAELLEAAAERAARLIRIGKTL